MATTDPEFDMRLRQAAMAWLNDRASSGDEFVHARDLASFTFEGERIALVNPQRGIHKPAALEAALSIRTTYTPPGREPPYADREGRDGLLRYKYQGDNPKHWENVALRRVYDRQLPLLWFVGIDRGIYLPRYPIWLVADEPEQLQVVVAMDASQLHAPVSSPMEEAVREYIQRLTNQRLHQPVFRARVLQAYQTRCAVCHLRHGELLDAAHILPDTHPRGRPVVPNGLSLCKIHHAAYDQNILGIRPDLQVEVRQDILTEIDGPMLQHGLQELAGTRVSVPRSREAKPDSSSLEERYEEFQSAA